MAEPLTQQEVDDFLEVSGFNKEENPDCADHIKALVGAEDDTQVRDCLEAINEALADDQPKLDVVDLDGLRQKVAEFRAAQAPPAPPAVAPPAGPPGPTVTGTPPTGPAATPPAGPAVAPPAGPAATPPVNPAATPPVNPAVAPPGPTVPGTPATTQRRPSRIGKIIGWSVAIVGLVALVWGIYSSVSWGIKEVAKMSEDNKPATTSPSAKKPVAPVAAAAKLTCTNAYGRVYGCNPVPQGCKRKLLEHLVFECPEGRLSSLAPRVQLPSGKSVQIAVKWTPN